MSESVLTTCMREIRQALRDEARAPRYLQTVHRRGYRFIAPVAASAAPVSSSKFQVPSSFPPPAPNTQHLTPSTHTEAEAEACFHKAIEIARRQGAKSLELRTVVSLSRLWQQQGKKQKARQMLTEIYGWFTEGFDTADLREARALLKELA